MKQFIGIIILIILMATLLSFIIRIAVEDTSNYHELEYFIDGEFYDPDELILEYQIIKKEYGNEIDKYYVIVTILTDDWVVDEEELFIKVYAVEIGLMHVEEKWSWTNMKLNQISFFSNSQRLYHINAIDYLNAKEINK